METAETVFAATVQTDRLPRPTKVTASDADTLVNRVLFRLECGAKGWADFSDTKPRNEARRVCGMACKQLREINGLLSVVKRTGGKISFGPNGTQ